MAERVPGAPTNASRVSSHQHHHINLAYWHHNESATHMAHENAAAMTQTRASSVESSALSSIHVAQVLDQDSSSERVPASTPPTSLAESSSAGSVKGTTAPSQQTATMSTTAEDLSGSRRPRRTRTSVNYNLLDLSNAQVLESANASRNVSGLTGRTLVSASEEDDGEEQTTSTPFGAKVEKAMDIDWEIEIPNDLPPRPAPGSLKRKTSVKDRVKKAAGKVGSVLGKRSREMVEAGKRKVEVLKGGNEKNSKYLKELDMGVKGVLDEMDFDDDDDGDENAEQARPTKRAKKEKAKATTKTRPTPPPLVKSSSATGNVTARKGKRWLKDGLYVGQSADSDGTQAGSKKKLQKKRPSSSASGASFDAEAPPAKRRTMMPMPMFGYLRDDKQADFKLPFDIFAPTFKKGDAKPKDWVDKPNRQNRIVGDAREIWFKKGSLAQSLCICQPPVEGEQGCDYDCLNRAMHYECNENNCMLNGLGCSNRPFAQLNARIKKGGPYDIGVEVIKTTNRGFGVRACRTFAPGEIIMEYTGEIITEYECERRMAEVYNKSDNYYLMQFDRGLVIDGTKGSMGRFVNHSCAPNCEVRMMRGADDRPHMGIFAGDAGVMTGEELTYDYNFDNFGSSQQQCHCGASSCRGFLSKRLNAAEQKLRDKEEKERQRKAAEEAVKNAEAAIQAKKEKDDRGPGWRGWLDLTDRQVRDQLKKEKQEKEEAAKNSDRARRMAARRGEVLPPVSKKEEPASKPVAEAKKPVRDNSRRQASGSTVQTQKSTIRKVPSSESPLSDSGRANSTTEIPTPKPKRPMHSSGRQTSSGSASNALLERASSIFSDDGADEENNNTAVADALDDEDQETVTLATTSTKTNTSKRRKLGKALKDVAGSVGLSRGNKRQAGAGAEAPKTPGKLRQSTLSFSKLI